MTRSLRVIATAALAFLAFFAAPLGASAVGGTPDTGGVVVNGTPLPGGTLQIEFTAYSFSPGEAVSVSVTGQGASTLAALHADTATVVKTASPVGAVSLTVTLPGDARGSYWIHATGRVSGTSSSALAEVHTPTQHALPAGGGETGSGARAGTGVSAATTLAAPAPPASIAVSPEYDPASLLDWAPLGVLFLGTGLLVALRLTRRIRSET
jgi:hypothetical protein